MFQRFIVHNAGVYFAIVSFITLVSSASVRAPVTPAAGPFSGSGAAVTAVSSALV